MDRLRIQGQILNATSGMPLIAQLQLLDDGGKRSLFTVQSDQEGRFIAETRLNVDGDQNLTLRVKDKEGSTLTTDFSARSGDHLVLLKVEPGEHLTVEDKPPPSRLRLRGRVLFSPGGWGESLALAKADVVIFDVNPDDSRTPILVTQTDESGEFAGVSEPWKETVQRVFWDFQGDGLATEEVLLEDDLLHLEIQIQSHGRTVTLPFPFVYDNIPVTTRVDWEPMKADLIPLAEVNGVACYSPEVLGERLQRALITNERMTVRCYGQTAAILGELTTSAQGVRSLFSRTAPSFIEDVKAFDFLVGRSLRDMTFAAIALTATYPTATREVCSALFMGATNGRRLGARLNQSDGSVTFVLA